jgi:hypothetical protein
MPAPDCQKIIDQYIKWIKDNTSIRTAKEDGFCEITTPFLDRHNDHLEIYVTKKEDKIILSDDGYILADLTASGVEINTDRKQTIFKMALNGFGVKIGENNQLCIEANMNNVGQKKHYLLQAMLAINDMFVLSRENIYSLFKDEVEKFFKTKEIIYAKDIKLTGKTGFDHNIDFLVARTKTRPERLIKTINTPKKDQVMASIFSFTDIAVMRESKTSNYVIYNDTDNPISPDALSALNNYGIKNIPWSQKHKCQEEFSLV